MAEGNATAEGTGEPGAAGGGHSGEGGGEGDPQGTAVRDPRVQDTGREGLPPKCGQTGV